MKKKCTIIFTVIVDNRHKYAMIVILYNLNQLESVKLFYMLLCIRKFIDTHLHFTQININLVILINVNCIFKNR